jgi:hypothetical protein
MLGMSSGDTWHGLTGKGNLYRQIESESLRLKLDSLIQDGISWYVTNGTPCDLIRGNTE